MPKRKEVPAKPVKLQVNTAGAWKDVAFFDAADQAMTGEVMNGADMIGRVTASTFRIVMQDGLQTVLMRWSKDTGWQER